ncbi:MAG: PD40 domain-containing protein [Bryobacteraceae bacterium]|nr:PD40 domain-containing protein [Bryobacteraceae bacterium]
MPHRFGPYEVDFSTSELRKSGTRLRLAAQPMKVLEALIEQPGMLVTREQLRDRLWAPDTFVDFETSLNGIVAKLRQALSDSADQPLYVETVARKGYRFVAPVTTERALPENSWQAEPAPPAVAPQKNDPRRWRTAAAGLLAVSGLLFFAFGRWGTSTPKTSPPMMSFDIDVGDDFSQPAISQDGLKMVWVTKHGLVLRPLDQAKITQIEGTERASYPFFSPDGKWVGFFTDRKLRKVSLEGGASLTLCDAPLPGGATWGEDDHIIAALQISGGLFRIPASGGTPESFTRLSEPPGFITNHRSPHRLPGGKGVLFVAGPGVAGGSIRVQPLGGGPAKVLVEEAATARYLPSGYLVYFKSGAIFAAPMDLSTLELNGPASRIAEGVAYDLRTGADFDVSASGTLVFRKSAVRGNRNAVWMDASGREQPLIGKPGNYASPRLSPDGKRLAFASIWAGQRGIGVYDLTRQTETRLTFDSTPQCCPIWSPDGEYLVFFDAGDLAWISSDGKGNSKPGRLPSPDHTAVPWSFSPDGKWLAFHRSQPPTGYDLWVAPVDRSGDTMKLGPPKVLLRQPGVQAGPAISPDGRWVAYGSDELGRVELFVMPFSPNAGGQTSKWQVTFDGAISPVWSRGGQELFYRGTDRRVMSLSYTTKGDAFLASKPHVWAEKRMGDVGPIPSFDVAGDGKRIVALLDAELARPDETHLRVLLNVDDEMARRKSERQPH